MLSSDAAATRTWGARTLGVLDSLAESRARTELRAHALNNLGTIEVVAGDRAAGIAMLEESLVLARQAELHEHAARLRQPCVERDCPASPRRESSRAGGDRVLHERDLDSWTSYLLACDAELQVNRGDLAAAERQAEAVSPTRLWRPMPP